MKCRYFLLLLLIQHFLYTTGQTFPSDEKWRPKLHFTPQAHWMNDPNGMVFYKGVYHLFYQYYPGASVWGPMHWGHASSTDLVQWRHEPVALFPDSLGTIFSGSAVLDKNNSSGFGTKENPPLVAVFTQHNEEERKRGSTRFQNQSIAFSADNGTTWTKYSGNPVLKNPGHIDFRDPKITWHEESKKWIMALAVGERIHFYSSANLKEWAMESEFGEGAGKHGSVWECPDLFPMKYKGKTVWVLIVNLNPGGPNGGSATQYFLGDFDGKRFLPYSKEIKWLDYGPDEYAGVTWSNTGKRNIYLGWMSNWDYAQVVPTETWRSAMTVARDLALKKIDGEFFLTSNPVEELAAAKRNPLRLKNISLKKNFFLKTSPVFILDAELDNKADLTIEISNRAGEQVLVGFNKSSNSYFIDRSKSGKTDFHKNFPGKFIAPRLEKKSPPQLKLVVDVSSVELFADDGLTVMTAVFFPSTPFTSIIFRYEDGAVLKKLEFGQ